MVPADSIRIPRVPTYSGYCYQHEKLLVQDFHSLRYTFPDISDSFPCRISQSYNPANAVTFTVWATSISLAATLEIDVSFFSSSYLDVSVQRVCSPCGAIGLLPIRLPHSDICGSSLVCKSPQLFAAYHVLLSLQEPRHPPYALFYFLTYRITHPFAACDTSLSHP